MTCENSIMGSKKKLANGMLLSVGVWMMMSYSTFGMKSLNDDNNLNDNPLIGNNPGKNLNNGIPIKINEQITNYKPIPKVDDIDMEINETKYDTIKDDKKKQEVLSTDIIHNVFDKDNDLKKCIEDIEKKEDFTVKYARCCCWSGSIVDAKITDIKGNTKATVKELIRRSLVPDKTKLGNYFIPADKVNDSLEVKTGIYDVVANKIDDINGRCYIEALKKIV